MPTCLHGGSAYGGGGRPWLKKGRAPSIFGLQMGLLLPSQIPGGSGGTEHCTAQQVEGVACVYIKRLPEGRAGLRPPPGKCLSNSSPLLAGCFGSHGVLPDSPPAPEPQRSGLPTLPHIRQCGAPASPCPHRPGWLPPGRTPR